MAGRQPTSRGYRVFPAFVIFQQSIRHLVVDTAFVAPHKKSVTSFFCGAIALGILRNLVQRAKRGLADKNTICVGAIIGAFGVKGEVRLKSFCAVAEDIDSYGPLSSEDGSQTFDLKISRPVKGGLAARIGGVKFKDQADKLRGVRLYVSRDALPNLPDDEYYYSDLMGLNVLDTGGETLGKVRAVHDHGAGEFLEVRLKSGGDVLVPFTTEAVPTIDIASARIIIDPPEGVMPEPKSE